MQNMEYTACEFSWIPWHLCPKSLHPTASLSMVKSFFLFILSLSLTHTAARSHCGYSQIYTQIFMLIKCRKFAYKNIFDPRQQRSAQFGRVNIVCMWPRVDWAMQRKTERKLNIYNVIQTLCLYLNSVISHFIYNLRLCEYFHSVSVIICYCWMEGEETLTLREHLLKRWK